MDGHHVQMRPSKAFFLPSISLHHESKYGKPLDYHLLLKELPLDNPHDSEMYLPDYFTSLNTKRSEQHIDLNSFQSSAEKEAWAWNLRPQRYGEDTFIRYIYEYGRFKYGFAWTTPWDEAHRMCDPQGMQEEPEWYDDIYLGQRYKIRITPRRPKEHLIIDPVFAAMNSSVFYLGNIKDK
jgi:hypothetical protein